MQHIKVLDGWRGISILCVLAGHMLPLGPKFLQLNETVASTGMALFFILSGFLIVSLLLRNDNAASFLVRRCCRILPLAWSYLVVVLLLHHAALQAWTANLLFYANLPPFYLDYTNAHFWSLCVEVQFYVAIALVVAIGGRRWLVIVPAICVAATAARFITGHAIAIETWWCIDEILAGGCLALILASVPKIHCPALTPFIFGPLLIAACHPATGILNNARPYFAAVLVGSTLIRAEDFLTNFLNNRILRYLAEISYALYVIHPLTYEGWLGTGDTFLRYAKRLVSIVLSFIFAYISTHFFESYWINLGRRMGNRLDARRSLLSKPGHCLSTSDRDHASKGIEVVAAPPDT